MGKIYKDISELTTLSAAHKKDGRQIVPTDLSSIKNGAVVFNDSTILWVGKSSDIPQEYSHFETHSLNNHTLTPEVVESHTHLVFAGDRSQEYADRLNGVTYEQIAARGGGILFTVEQTQSSSTDELFKSASHRIEKIYSYGIGTIEIKSGYGLSFDKELEISLIIDRLKKKYRPRIQIFNTFLAAHDIPKTFSSSKEYLSEVVIPLIQHLAPLKIIDAVDIFHEKNYFSKEDVKLLFEIAQQNGIQRKIHADELNDNSGAEIAIDFSALSADHLLKISDQGIQKLAASSTVATLLPGTALFLGKNLAPSQKLLNAGAKVALASDYNPGSCHCDNLILIASVSAKMLGLNQAQLWTSITLNAAHALGLKNQGAIIPGMSPRFSLFEAKSLAQITYHWGTNLSRTLP